MPRRRLLLTALALLAARPASAHAILLASDPTAGAELPAGPRDIKLSFNSRLDAARCRLVLVDAAGHATTLAVQPGDKPNELRAPATLVPGAAVIRWQVLATDGHFTRGEIRFSVKAAR